MRAEEFSLGDWIDRLARALLRLAEAQEPYLSGYREIRVFLPAIPGVDDGGSRPSRASASRRSKGSARCRARRGTGIRRRHARARSRNQSWIRRERRTAKRKTLSAATVWATAWDCDERRQCTGPQRCGEDADVFHVQLPLASLARSAGPVFAFSIVRAASKSRNHLPE